MPSAAPPGTDAATVLRDVQWLELAIRSPHDGCERTVAERPPAPVAHRASMPHGFAAAQGIGCVVVLGFAVLIGSGAIRG